MNPDSLAHWITIILFLVACVKAIAWLKDFRPTHYRQINKDVAWHRIGMTRIVRIDSANSEIEIATSRPGQFSGNMNTKHHFRIGQKIVIFHGKISSRGHRLIAAYEKLYDSQRTTIKRIRTDTESADHNLWLMQTIDRQGWYPAHCFEEVVPLILVKCVKLTKRDYKGDSNAMSFCLTRRGQRLKSEWENDRLNCHRIWTKDTKVSNVKWELKSICEKWHYGHVIEQNDSDTVKWHALKTDCWPKQEAKSFNDLDQAKKWITGSR